MITERQETLLDTIINEHIKTAEPVGSDFLVERYKLEVSSATVRNEMLELDKKGYLEKTHTSSGRVPTERAYEFYVENVEKPVTLPKNIQVKLENSMHIEHETVRDRIKELAKAMAHESEEFVLVAFQENDFYYTGLSNLFGKPEFSNYKTIWSLSSMIDHLDASLSRLYRKELGNETGIFIGKDNPIDKQLSLITAKLNQQGPLIALLGPMRMKYKTNIGLLEYSKKLLTAQ